MGGLVSSLGFGAGGNDTGNAGTGFAAGAAPLLQTVNQGSLSDSFGRNATAIDQQNAFLAALQAQNGITNQSDVYNQLSGIANGTGPNPAQAALNQATGANVANQAALMAGQRGAGSNVGLLARQAAMQGGNIQQQAAGQGATLQAQQALNAIGQMGNISGQQVANQAGATQASTNAAQNYQQNVLNAANQLNQANVGMKSNQNSTNQGIANTVAQGQQGLLGSITGGIGGVLGGVFAHGGEVKNYARGGDVPNPPLEGSKDKGKSGPIVSDPNNPVIKSIGKSFGFADGGGITAGFVNPADLLTPSLSGLSASTSSGPANGPQSNVGKFHMNDSMATPQLYGGSSNSGAAALQKGGADLGRGIGSAIGNLFASKGSNEGAMTAGGADDIMPSANAFGDSQGMSFMAAKGGPVKAVVSPGEIYLSPAKVEKVVKGKASPVDGEKIKGQAKVKGDSLKNDTVPKTLEEGGIVLPRSVTQSKDPAKKASEFVAAILSKKGKL